MNMKYFTDNFKTNIINLKLLFKESIYKFKSFNSIIDEKNEALSPITEYKGSNKEECLQKMEIL